MICPVCGSQALQLDGTAWCSSCRIVLEQNLEVETPQEPVLEEKNQESGRPFKIIDILVTLIIFILFIVIVAVFAWGYFHGDFNDTAPILPK